MHLRSGNRCFQSTDLITVQMGLLLSTVAGTGPAFDCSALHSDVCSDSKIASAQAMLPTPLVPGAVKGLLQGGEAGFPSMLGIYAAMANGTVPADDMLSFAEDDQGPTSEGLGVGVNQVRCWCHSFAAALHDGPAVRPWNAVSAVMWRPTPTCGRHWIEQTQVFACSFIGQWEPAGYVCDGLSCRCVEHRRDVGRVCRTRDELLSGEAVHSCHSECCERIHRIEPCVRIPLAPMATTQVQSTVEMARRLRPQFFASPTTFSCQETPLPQVQSSRLVCGQPRFVLVCSIFVVHATLSDRLNAFVAAN